MTATATSAGLASRSNHAALLPMASLLASLLCFAAYQAVAWGRAGVFEYPLDDVYIHLAMAEGIAAGGYGINPGEYASADSSALYPFLLVPFAGSGLQFWLPLFWNMVGLVLSALFWGMIVARAALPHWPSLALAVAGPVALNMPGVAFLGMEHALHAAAALATLLGLLRLSDTGRVGWLLVAGILLMPAMRLEGAAFALLAAAAALAMGHRRAGLLLAVLAIAPVLGFMAGLTALGLDPLPGSVMAKLNHPDMATLGWLDRKFFTAARNVMDWPGKGFAASALLVTVIASVGGFLRGGRWPLYLAVIGAAWAHFFLGQTGWMHRYEHYVLLLLAAAAVLMSGEIAARRGGLAFPAIALPGVILLAAGINYVPNAAGPYLNNPDLIHRQQGELSRFAKTFIQGPVAVNDIGYVAWANDAQVLDLWGLASAEAREARMSKAPGWAGPLVTRSGAKVVMIYDHWIEEGIDPAWVPLGTYVTAHPGAFIGGGEIRFYAPTAALVPELTALLREWAAGLPPQTEFRFETDTSSAAENG